eukprot:SAG31_NODE_19950_length_587_cov_223.825820_1_plen_27_part_10
MQRARAASMRSAAYEYTVHVLTHAAAT